MPAGFVLTAGKENEKLGRLRGLKLKRVVLYSALIGYAIPVIEAAYPQSIPSSLIHISICTLGNQMGGAIAISGPENAVFYAIIGAMISGTVIFTRKHPA
jgi:hypothetical protein